MILVEKVYGRRHTENSKQLNLFMSRQKSSEGPMAFARQNLLYQEANLTSISVEEMRAFFLIAGMTNEQLRQKLLELKTPTYEQLMEKIASPRPPLRPSATTSQRPRSRA